jgi:hypothetical protein
MKNRILAVFVISFGAGPAIAAAQGSDPGADLRGDCGNIRRVATYGEDNRAEYCSQNILIRDLADSTAGLFFDGSSATLKGLPYTFGTTTLGTSQRLAPDQRFAEQPADAFCTGFLVGEDLLVTAGHCVKDHRSSEASAPKDHDGACQENLRQGKSCEYIKVVFGFRKELGGWIPRSVPADNVYKCAKVVAHSLGSGPDYAVIRLDRKVAGRRPLAINRNNAGLSAETPLFVIGHPSGIPLKIAGDAKVVSISTDVYVNVRGTRSKWTDKGYSFLTNLDTFHGNSGSPVFSLNTMLVEGILVSGDEDYEAHPDNPLQNRVTNFPQNAGAADYGKGTGEVCTKISVPAGKIPATSREATMLEMNGKANNRLYPVMLEMLRKRAGEHEQQQPRIIPIPNYVPPQRQEPKVQWI